MYKTILIAMLISISTLVYASDQVKTTFPKEVTAFIEKRDLCDHFRGEDPYDEERRIFLYKNIAKLCTGSDQELATLKNKYSNNPYVLEKLSVYEEDIEPNN